MTLVHVGVDPGDSTGMAVVVDGTLWYVGQGAPAGEVAVLRGFLEQYRAPRDRVCVGTERFVITSQTGRRTQQTTALEVTGIVDHLVTESGHALPVRQTISDVKKFVSNDLLRRVGWYVTGAQLNRPDADDANDALRHVIYLLAQTNPAEFGKLLRRARVIG